MNSIIVLSDRDHSKLSALLYHRLPGLIPHPIPHAALSGFLEASRIDNDPQTLRQRVELRDHVILHSPEHDIGQHEFRIVLPADVDTSPERLSVLSPLGLALLGRRVGELVSLANHLPMTITEVRKNPLAPA